MTMTAAGQMISVSVKTAAAVNDLSESTIRQAIDKQELPAYRVGMSIRISADDLRNWLTNHPRIGSDQRGRRPGE